MSCYGWTEVIVDGCGLGMGTNSKEMLGSSAVIGEIFGHNQLRS